jgi:hypothetical protein
LINGITTSRYPSRDLQLIPSFSIWWIAMIHDYWMLRGNNDYVASFLPYTRLVMDYYERNLTENGSLSFIPYWFFTDWADGFWGNTPRMPDGKSSIQDLHFLTGLQKAAEMERNIGLPAMAEHYEQVAEKIKSGFAEKYRDNNRRLFADTQEKKQFSQHANILAILTGVVQGKEATDLMERILSEKELIQATIYFKYYLNMALNTAGLGDRYLDMLDIWHTNLANGLTTWAESPEPSRSDCHAWGASPNVELFRTTLGVSSAAPGFEKVRIAPHPGKLNKASGCMPHPKGDICVDYQLDKKGNMKAEITLPEGISGVFVWKGKETPLHGGKQILN